MDAQQLATLLTFLKGVGLTGLLMVALYANYRRRFVWDWQYDECIQRTTHLEAELAEARANWADAVRVWRRVQELHVPSDEGC